MLQENTDNTEKTRVVQRNVTLAVSFDELQTVPTLHCRGYMRPKIAKILKELLRNIEENEIFQATASYSVINVAQTTNDSIELIDGTKLCSPLVVHKIKAASKIMPTVTSLGPQVGILVQQYFETGKQLKAVLLEEIANFYLFKLNEHYLQVANDTAFQLNLQSSGPLCPGDDGFDLSQQAIILSLAGGQSLGIELSKRNMMNPRHSHTQLVGLGKRMKGWGYQENCCSCKARNNCQYFKQK